MLGIESIRRALRNREVSAVEIVDTVLSRINRLDKELHAFLEVFEVEARLAAAKIDAKLSAGEDPGPLAGVPVAVKDNICVKGFKCTCASRILEGYVSPYDATCVKKLKDAGAIIIGRTNMDEFAMGSSTENSAYGVTRNPWDKSRVPGGSSGGSAASVASYMVPVALGSDTGGSIRQPASFTGTYGLKPTYGLVSRYGLVAFASSLDQIGPIANSVEDIALVMDVIAGHDELDATSSPRSSVGFASSHGWRVRGLRAGVPKELLSLGVSRSVRDVFDRVLARLTELGVIVEETSLPSLPLALDTYYIIAPAEASSNLARFDGVRYGMRVHTDSQESMYRETRGAGFGAEVKRRIMLGTFALSAGYYDAYYLRAAKVRTLIRRDFERAFQSYDVLLSPTTPDVAFKIGERVEDPLSMYAADVLTVPVNLAGIPAFSVPCGTALAADGSGPLPVGLQIMGRYFDEGTILGFGRAVEELFGEEMQLEKSRLESVEECEIVG